MLPIITDTFDQLGNLAMDANVYEMMQIHGFGVLSSVDDVQKYFFDGTDTAGDLANLTYALYHDMYYGLSNATNLKKWGNAFNNK